MNIAPIFSQSNCPMKMGVNLYFNEYWSGEFPFSNLMLQSSPKWIVRDINNPEPDEWASDKYHDSLTKDMNGYPIEIPQTFKSQDEPQIAMSILFLDSNGPYPSGNYTLLYDGNGEINLFGGDVGSIISKTTGRIVFKVNNNYQGVGIQITKSTKGNHIRNIRVLLPDTENTIASHPFNPQFLKQLEPFSCIRFLNWGGVNNSTQNKWEDRNLPTYFTQSSSSKGAVAYEYMIQLCNILKKDMWICIPHAASADYRINLATLLKNQLDPSLKIYLEYSNEVWNDIFEQHWYIKDNAPSDIVFHTHKYAYLANECFKSFESIFGNNSNRLIRVLAGQHYNPWILEEAVAKMKEIGGKFDALSVASYFAPIGLNGNLTVNEIAQQTKAEIANHAKNHILSLSILAKANNVPVVMYEGGPHMTKDQFGGLDQPFVPALCQFHESQQMYEIYNDWLHFLKDTAHVELNNILGFQDDICYFGHIKNLWDNNPTLKMKAVLDNICKTVDNQYIDKIQGIVYPNPFLDNIYIQLPFNELSSIELRDINGQLIKNYQSNIEHNLLSIRLANLSSGFYYLRISQNDSYQWYRIVKM